MLDRIQGIVDMAVNSPISATDSVKMVAAAIVTLVAMLYTPAGQLVEGEHASQVVSDHSGSDGAHPDMRKEIADLSSEQAVQAQQLKSLIQMIDHNREVAELVQSQNEKDHDQILRLLETIDRKVGN